MDKELKLWIVHSRESLGNRNWLNLVMTPSFQLLAIIGMELPRTIGFQVSNSYLILKFDSNYSKILLLNVAIGVRSAEAVSLQ